MDNQVHFIPVGFDFDRLIHPIAKGGLDADRVVLVTHDEGDDFGEQEQAAALAGGIVRRLKDSFDLIDVTVEQIDLEHDEMYAFEELYPLAHRYLLKELRKENEVFVNISSMPRPVAFAFATAADSLITENPEDMPDIRQRLHTYYVRPEQYVVHELVEALEDEVDYLKQLADANASKRRSKLQALIDKVEEGGVTEGTLSPQDSDKMYVEFPASPGAQIEDTEKQILRFLGDRDEPMRSISDLAEELAAEQGIDYDDSFRSKIQYNVTRLEEKGYVDREDAGNRKQTTLSTMGRMWIETH